MPAPEHYEDDPTRNAVALSEPAEHQSVSQAQVPAKQLRVWPLLGALKSSGQAASQVTIPASAADPETVLLLSQIRALELRMKRRAPTVMTEVVALLQGVVNAASSTAAGDDSKRLTAAREGYTKAEDIFLAEVQTKNRLFYLLGLFAGVTLVVPLPIGIVWLIQGQLLPSSEVHVIPWSVIPPLVGFAGLGAIASVLSRLSTLDLRNETSRWMVGVSAAARPILAVAFALIMYVIVKGKLLTVGTETTGAEVKDAVLWVAAFLCGYSERFAADILEKLPLGKSKEEPAKK